jgi:stage II sporulation protein D
MKPWMARAARRLSVSAMLVILGALLSIPLVVPLANASMGSSGSSLGTSLGTSLGNSSEIRVRLNRVQPSFTLAGMALRYPGASVGLSRGLDMEFKAIKVTWEKKRVGGASFYQWTLKDRDSGKLLSQFQSKKFEVAGLSMRVNLKSVPDRLSFVPMKTGADLIAQMDLEEYLRGVIPSEMPANWPMEALKAQAVAARTYALYRKSLREDSHFDVEADVMDQVFTNPLGLVTDKKASNAERAVRETRGIVLLDRHGQPLPSYFHADCGGRTEEARELWGGGERQGTAVDGSCPLNPAARWRAVVSAADLSTKLKAYAPVETRLASLEALDKTSSGRLAHLKLKWSDGSDSIITGHDFRMAIGHDRIRSTSFEFSKKAEAFEFAGVGFGHGVGMCQWGAKSLALNGAFYSEILQHYYPKAVIKEPMPL